MVRTVVREIVSAELESMLRKFNPNQPRDDGGQWAAFGGIPAFAKELSALDGTVGAVVGKDGLRLELANNRSGTNRSGGLDRSATWKLGNLLESAADWNPHEDGFPGEEDQPRMVTRSVYTYPEDAPPDATATGYAAVSHDGTGNIELELLDNEEKVRLTRGEAKQLADTARQAAAVSRVTARSGTLDVFPTNDRKVGLRLNAADGSVVEPAFDGKSWNRLTDAINVISEGFDEMEKFVKAPNPDSDDPLPDVESLEVNTNVGRMRVYRTGGVTEVEDPNYGTESHSFGPVDGSWTVTMSAHYADPVNRAFNAIEQYADIPGLDRATPRGGTRPAVRPRVRALAADLLDTRDMGNPGKQYWTKDPQGLAKWATHAHPWTALYHHVLKFDGMTPGRAKEIASKWFHDVFGFWPGDRKGKNPVGPRGTVRPHVRALVTEVLRMAVNQPRDEDGKWSKLGAVKNALAAVAGVEGDEIHSGYGVATFPDREGVATGRAVEWEYNDDEDTFTLTVYSDENETYDDGEQHPPTLKLRTQQLTDLATQMATDMLRRQAPPLDPNDRQSVLLHSILQTNGLGAAVSVDDETYIDIGEGGLEVVGEDGDSIRFDLSPEEFAQMHAAIALTLAHGRPDYSNPPE